MGHTVLGKTICENYKTKKRRKAKPEELMIFKNTHPAIVDEETWHLAQKLRKTVRRPSYPDRKAHPLTGLVYCADCGSKMTRRQPGPNKKVVYDSDDAYICSSYRQLLRDCTMHFIKTSVLWELVKTAIQNVSRYVLENEKEFIKRISDTSDILKDKTVKEYSSKIKKLSKRNEELNELIKKLYEGNATGKIPDKHFERLLADYDTEQTEIEEKLSELNSQVTELTDESNKADKFVKIVKRYTDFTEITTPMLNEFIEKIIVHEADTSEGRLKRKQSVDIYFNFVGNIAEIL